MLAGALVACTTAVALVTSPAFAENKAPVAATSDKQIPLHVPDREKPPKIAADVPLAAPVINTADPFPKPNGKLLSATMETTIKAPVNFVWQQLTDFSGYPTVFPRIESCKVLKRQGNYVYTESNLRPQLFLKETRQKIINDLTGKPHVFRWAMLQGNFNSSQGCWKLEPDSTGKYCNVTYTLESTSDAIPKSIASVSLKFIQKDIVKTFKRVVEKQYLTTSEQAGPVAVTPQ